MRGMSQKSHPSLAPVGPPASAPAAPAPASSPGGGVASTDGC